MGGDSQSPYWRELKRKPWEKAGMTQEEYGYLLAFCAANPLLIQKLIIHAGKAIEKQAEEGSDG